MAPAFQLYGRKAKQNNSSLWQHTVWEETVPPVLTLMLDNSVPLPLSLAPFELLPQNWSLEPLSSVKSVLPFKRNTWNSSSSLSHLALISTGWYSHKLWQLIFMVLEPWTGGSAVGLSPLTPQAGPQQPRYPSQFLTWVWDQFVLHLCPYC